MAQMPIEVPTPLDKQMSGKDSEKHSEYEVPAKTESPKTNSVRGLVQINLDINGQLRDGTTDKSLDGSWMLFDQETTPGLQEKPYDINNTKYSKNSGSVISHLRMIKSFHKERARQSFEQAKSRERQKKKNARVVVRNLGTKKLQATDEKAVGTESQ